MEMNIGLNIKRLRVAKNITQEQLSVAMNVTCAAVSKWERGETYPDITLLQPLAYYFEVTLDELMGYDQEKVNADIEEILSLYQKHWDDPEGRELIAKAYRSYPNDYRIMHLYMWNIIGDRADNDPAVLLENKDELLTVSEKIIDGCTDEHIRLGAWVVIAKILHADGKTDEALDIFKSKFFNWYDTCGQFTEQLFAKDTSEYYFYVQKNMYQLADFASDKLGRKVFFSSALSFEEKTERALCYGDIMLDAFNKTGEGFFLMVAVSFLGRMQNDLYYRGGENSQIAAVTDKYLYATKLLDEQKTKNEPLCASFELYSKEVQKDLFNHSYGFCSNRRPELLNDPAYAAVLDKYR